MSTQYSSTPQERGRRIREMRRKKGLTAEQLAELLRATTSTISRYETGITKHIQEPVLEAIAQYLDTDVHYLNTGEEARAPSVPGKPQDPDILESPVLPYKRVFRQSQVREILCELEMIRKIKSESGENRKAAGSSPFIMIVEEESAQLQILCQDHLSIQPSEHLVPEKVNFILDSDKKIRFFRALKMENTTVLQISGHEAVSEANLAKYGLKLIGYCVKLERKNV